MALPKTFTGGERLFADDLNDNFEDLDTRLVAAESDIDTNASNLANASNLTSGTIPAARFPANTIVQVKTFSFDDAFIQSFANSTPVVVPDFKLAITPLFANSKILVDTTLAVSSSNSESYSSQMYRKIGAGSEVFNHDIARIIRGVASTYEIRHSVVHMTRNYLDAPATTEEVTYQVYVKSSGPGASLSVNRSQIEEDRDSNSHITLYEVKV